MHVVNDVQVVVQKQESKPATTFHDNAAGRGARGGLVFQKRTQFQNRSADVDRNHVLPASRWTDPNGTRNDRNSDQMHRPLPNNIRRALLPFTVQKHRRSDQRPYSQAPDQCVVDHEQPLCDARQPRPDVRIEEIRLRIIIGVGQLRIIMVRQMGVAKPRIGNHNDQRHKRQRSIQPRGRKRMPVQRLMLER